MFDKIIKTLRLRSIQFVITISFTTISVAAVIFVGFISYSKFSEISEKNAALSTEQLVNQINYNIEYYLSSMINISNVINDSIYTNPNIENADLKEQMLLIQNTRRDIATIALFSENGKIIYSTVQDNLKENSEVNKQKWFQNAMNHSYNLTFSAPHDQNIFENRHDWVVSLSREVNYNDGNKNLKGVLLVDMNYSVIRQLCQNTSIGKNGYIYIVDSDNNIIYNPKQQPINMDLKNSSEGDKLITTKIVSYTNWKVIAVAYTSEMVASKQDIIKFIICVILFSAVLIFLIISVLSAKISEPIKNLEKSMKKVEEGEFNIFVEAKGEDEVVKLSKTFNLMISKVQYLMKQIVVEQESKRQSELDALQAQINPHFLYNTLDSVVWMAESGKNQHVITMVTALAKLFRISISRGLNFITVEQEIEHVKNYLIIQKMRYGDKFNYKINISQEVKQLKTLKLILQPLVENSIYHGIEYMQDEGQIKISACISDGKLLYIVEDNGLGIDSEKLNMILNYDGKINGGSGVGIKNVHERIQLTYGKQYGLEIESELEVGTTIKIWLPNINGVSDEKKQ